MRYSSILGVLELFYTTLQTQLFNVSFTVWFIAFSDFINNIGVIEQRENIGFWIVNFLCRPVELLKDLFHLMCGDSEKFASHRLFWVFLLSYIKILTHGIKRLHH